MIISLIAALDRQRIIGKNNQLPWYLPADLKRFRKLTTGKAVIMGRKTFESIGKALPNRLNIVLTRDPGYQAPGCLVVNSPEDALKEVQKYEEVFVIGGEAVFRQYLPKAQKMYLTMIDHDFGGEISFPDYNQAEWLELEREHHEAEGENVYSYDFVLLERRR